MHGKASSAKQRKKISITVYNQNFALVREIREVDLGTGRVSLEFGDVSGNIQPETVHIKPLGNPNDLTVLEQNYRNDLLTPAKLLEEYVGKNLEVYRFNETTGKDERYDAKLLSAEKATRCSRSAARSPTASTAASPSLRCRRT